MGNNAHVNPTDIYWRAAAGIAAVDLLEAAGYSVEVVAWWRSENSYPNKDRDWDCFASIRLKDAGEVLSVESLANGLSGWYFRTVMFAVLRSKVGWTCGLGRTRPTIEGYEEHLDVSQGTRKVFMGSPTTREEAVAAALKLIAEVQRDDAPQ